MRVQHKDKNDLTLAGKCDWCPDRPGYVRTGFDHCHKHGWIRGELCDSHNIRMRKIDSGIFPSSWEPWIVEHFNRCPDCRAADSREVPRARALKAIEGMTIPELIDAASAVLSREELLDVIRDAIPPEILACLETAPVEA